MNEIWMRKVIFNEESVDGVRYLSWPLGGRKTPLLKWTVDPNSYWYVVLLVYYVDKLALISKVNLF